MYENASADRNISVDKKIDSAVKTHQSEQKTHLSI